MSKNNKVTRTTGRATVAFLLLVMANDAVHAHHEASHGNRRERIEEARQRLEEARNNARAMRDIRTGGGGEPPAP